MKALLSGLRQRGMSMVELMVGMLIAMIGVVVIFQVFAVNEGVRRSTTAGSDEQTSGLLALLLLEREVRTAGYGINDWNLLGCNMQVWDTFRSPNAVPDFPLAPVQIVANAGNTPDVIRVMYGGVTRTSAAVQLGAGMDTPTSPMSLTFRYGFTPSDVVVVGQNGANCTLREVTRTPGLIELEHGPGAYVNGYTNQSQTPRWNNPAGTPVAYGYLIGRVLNLGPSPIRNEITVRVGDPNPANNNQLVLQNLFGQAANPDPIGEQIVQFKAEYGMDDGVSNGTVTRATYLPDDNVVDKFTTTNPTTPNGWARVRTVRVAIVSRSLTPEKPNAGTTCDATPDFTDDANYQVRWARGPDSPSGRKLDVRHTADWRCFKYRVYETTIPLRNLLWRQS